MSERTPEPAGSDTTLTGRRNEDSSHLLVGFGSVALLAACCAGPALLAAGTLAVIGVAERSPWAIGAAAVLVAVALHLTAKRWALRAACRRLWPTASRAAPESCERPLGTGDCPDPKRSPRPPPG